MRIRGTKRERTEVGLEGLLEEVERASGGGADDLGQLVAADG